MRKLVLILTLLLAGCATGPKDTFYLKTTAGESETIQRQGVDVAVGRLHPIFAKRMAATIKDARSQGLDVGVVSAYRPPGFNIGGYADKFNSLHAYGLAADVYGVGGPESPEAEQFYEIARKHHVWNPYYGTPSWTKEYNHYQMFKNIKKIPPSYKLRTTITAEGPVELRYMWLQGTKVFFWQWAYKQ